MHTLLIFGAEGQLGSAAVKFFSHDFKVVALGRAQANITDTKQVSKVFIKYKPTVVLNAAAYNQVERAETQVGEAYKINAIGPFILAQATKKHNALLIHFSTDYVFDGSRKFFTETDRVHPINVYGGSKLAGEQLIDIAGAKAYVIRTTALFSNSSQGKINFMDRILSKARAGEKIKAVNDQFTCPTYVPDLLGKIKQLILADAPFGIYHITNRGSSAWYGYAAAILKLSGLKAPLKAITTAESGTKIKRPRYSVLKNVRLQKEGLGLLPPWQQAVKRYLKEKLS